MQSQSIQHMKHHEKIDFKVANIRQFKWVITLKTNTRLEIISKEIDDIKNQMKILEPKNTIQI